MSHKSRATVDRVTVALATPLECVGLGVVCVGGGGGVVRPGLGVSSG